MMPNFKNPQRVCDNCYAEVQQSKWQLGNPNLGMSQMDSSVASNMENSAAAAIVSAIDHRGYQQSDHRNSLWDEQVH